MKSVRAWSWPQVNLVGGVRRSATESGSSRDSFAVLRTQVRKPRRETPPPPHTLPVPERGQERGRGAPPHALSHESQPVILIDAPAPAGAFAPRAHQFAGEAGGGCDRSAARLLQLVPQERVNLICALVLEDVLRELEAEELECRHHRHEVRPLPVDVHPCGAASERLCDLQQ